MNKGSVLRQHRRYMGYNLLAFTLFFALFGLILFAQISRSLYTRIDDELWETREIIARSPGFVEDQLNRRFDGMFPWGEPGEPRDAAPPELSMRLQIVVWSPRGEVLNEQALGRFYWEDVLSQLPLNPEQVDNIQSSRLHNGSRFRSLLFPVEEGDYYVQVLANIDGEFGVIENFAKTLVICVIVFVLLSISASYVVSAKSMEPIIKSWRRQTEFVENASHELRTPLAVVQNKLEAMLTTPAATILDKADSIAVALAETRRLTRLTADLMTLARADSDQTLLEKERFALDELVERLSEPYTELAAMQGKTLVLELGHREELLADRERIHELLVILLDNALKYTGEGDRVTITTDRQEGRGVIRVTDTGIGIGEESRLRVFDRFYREDRARSRELGGTGLGLSIAKWIVDAHGGIIRVQPNDPRGTVFEIRLPG